MDTATITEILTYLTERASAFLDKSKIDLQEDKERLDTYVNEIISKIPEQAREATSKEFDRCRMCAREWISVYCDSNFHKDIKADILKEEVMSFFFTMDERILSIQKNFFLLGMVDEIITPGKPFSEIQREAKIANSRIRGLAREQSLKPTCETKADTTSSELERRWFFGDDRNFLVSNEEGLSDREALDFLLG